MHVLLKSLSLYEEKTARVDVYRLKLAYIYVCEYAND